MNEELNNDLNDIFGDEGFDTESVEVSDNDFELIPPGWYPVEIADAEVLVTKAGNGKYLKIRFRIIGEEYYGRGVFANLNIRNPSPKAEEIGQRNLAAIGQAIGIARLTSSEQLLGGQLQARITVKKGDREFSDDNEVKGYKPLGEAVENTPQPSAATPRPAPPAANPTPTSAAPAPAAKAAPSRTATAAPSKRPWER